MDKDKESLIQQDFEDTFRYIYSEFSKDCTGEYILNEVQSLWIGWKAAHSKYHTGIVVELPEERGFTPYQSDTENSFDEGYDSALYDVKYCLNKAEVKYK